jgi:hypothetical protein
MESVCKARAAIFKAIDDVKTEVKDLEPFMSGEKARLTETHGTSAVVTAAVRDAMVRAWGVFESLYIATRQ